MFMLGPDKQLPAYRFDAVLDCASFRVESPHLP
jgi:hypothetical protein